ncbi:energy-coupling factor ABC transporter ATP-binding protein [uncultured Veillonella sp.]|uniref:energy-coupling factor ABC transporter ATP-binding protein n=1 Tax=uncultured Veillonella sp. TaxID=159268 RepID=UPI002601DDBF|nr:ABC transporter ATP-binding protein [uncultured Veillonella sp.]
MERVTDVSKLVYTHMQGGQFRWVTVSTLMLALGTILHLVSPSVAGITPNWMIATYCVAIHLTRPNYRQAVGIGLVAALINVMTSKSAFPYANLLSEPAGALVCAFVVQLFSRVKLGRNVIPPVVSGFFSTLVSGGIFVSILYVLLDLPLDVYLKGMWPLVLIISLCNAVVTPLLFIPAQRLFARRGYLPSADEVITSDHSELELVPAVDGKISMEHFTYYYGHREEPAIKDVNLVVNDGDFLVITGPAGCGKSTLCMAMIGAVPKFYGGRMEGMVFVNGKATTQLEIAELATEIGVVLADYDTQLVTMTVGEEVAFAMENRGYTPDEIKERSAIVFKQVGLEGMEERKITSLSGGQRQRLAIASVLATNPSILVLDEPTSSLDPEGTEELYRLVGSLNKDYGITVVVIDHDLQAVLPYANRVALMVDGALQCDDTAEATLRYMYEHNIYVDALPSIFVTYMRLEQGGYTFNEPWLSVKAAKAGLKN